MLQAESNSRVDSLLRQVTGLQGQLTSCQSKSSRLEAELAQRDRQLLRKCDELTHMENQVSFFDM